jgi:hypothetical protein
LIEKLRPIHPDWVVQAPPPPPELSQPASAPKP